MIKGSATIQFGSGSVASVACVDENNVGAIFMRSVSPGKIGRRMDTIDPEQVMKNPEVVIYFTNVEGIDAKIRELNDLKLLMSGGEETNV